MNLEQAMESMGSEDACLERLIDMFKKGTLTDDPLCTLACVMRVAASIIERLNGHDHDNDTNNDDVPLVIGDDAFSAKCCDLYQAMDQDGELPAGAPAGGGLILKLLLPILLERGAEWLRKWLEEKNA